ncbi:shikimate dehydrogenase [Maritimibacter dapengensis]
MTLGTAKTAQNAPDTAARKVQVGLIGRGIMLSRTPGMHVAEGHAHGLEYTYDFIDPETMSGDPALADLLDEAEASGFAGLNVTFPYKREVIELLDGLSDAAGKVGAVNTVVFREGKRFGHNTDFWGFAESLRQGLPTVAREAVLLLGAGGAGGAVGHALRETAVKTIFVYDQNAGAAEALAKDIGGRATTDLATAAAEADGIVNATPMGMAKLPGMAIPADLIEARHWVADIVYFPRETQLLATARAKGCEVLDGSGMAVFQAVRAFKLFTGLDPDPARMRATFEAFQDPKN